MKQYEIVDKNTYIAWECACSNSYISAMLRDLLKNISTYQDTENVGVVIVRKDELSNLLDNLEDYDTDSNLDADDDIGDYEEDFWNDDDDDYDTEDGYDVAGDDLEAIEFLKLTLEGMIVRDADLVILHLY